MDLFPIALPLLIIANCLNIFTVRMVSQGKLPLEHESIQANFKLSFVNSAAARFMIMLAVVDVIWQGKTVTEVILAIGIGINMFLIYNAYRGITRFRRRDREIMAELKKIEEESAARLKEWSEKGNDPK